MSTRSEALPGQGNVSDTVGTGDASAVRARLATAVGAPAGQVVAMDQVHGAHVAVVDATTAARSPQAPRTDALVTFAPSVALLVRTADCVPLVLADPVGGGIAAVHAGRAGVQRGVVDAAVSALAAPDPAQVQAWLGPSIRSCCYELDAASVAAFAAIAPESVSTTRWGTPSVDVADAVAGALGRVGLRMVTIDARCTHCAHPTLFSHRAQPGAGRQGTLVVRHATVEVPRG